MKIKQCKIKDMLVNNSGGFVAPNANKKRKPNDPCDDVEATGPIPRLPARALEYKNLPFRQQSVQCLLGTAIKYCREDTVHDKFIMLYYTRSQEVRKAVDQARLRLGTICNLSISAPYLTEHTKPTNHSKQVVRQMSEACAAGTQSVWDHESGQHHDRAPRTSDYRTMIIQGATPPDFIAALKICLHLAQEYSKQVCVRIASVSGGMNPLPIYDTVVQGYNDIMFEKKAQAQNSINVVSSRTSSQDSDDE